MKKGKIFSAVIVGVVLAIVGAALVVPRFIHHTPVIPHNPLNSQPLAATPQFGVFEPGIAKSYDPVQSFADTVGRKPNVLLLYQAWNVPFPAKFAVEAVQNGATPMIQVLPRYVSMKQLAQGRYDAYLRSYAEQVKTFGEHVIWSFAPEMNGWWYTWGWKHTPSKDFIKAWRHIYNVFQNVGATNVTWLWTVNRGVPGRTPNISHWWPGDKYVTWVGIDGYYFLRSATFGSVFGDTIGQVRRLTHKPLLLSEAAIGPKAGQAKKMPGLFRGIQKHHLLGLVWFDVSQHAGLYHQDWKIVKGTKAAQLFNEGLKELFK